MKYYAIILNYNSSLLSIKCKNAVLESLKDLDIEYEIFIVDNGSEEDSKSILNKDINGCKLIFTNSNLGYAGGNNFAIRNILPKCDRNDIINLLNPDVIIKKDALKIIFEYINKYPNIDIFGSLLLDKSERNILFQGKKFLFDKAYAKNITTRDDFTIDSDYVEGGFILFKAKVIKDINYFDESFFLYYEDSDFCIRAKKRGIKILIINKPLAINYSNSIIRKNIYSMSYYYYFTRNTILFYKRYNKKINHYLIRRQVISFAKYLYAYSKIEFKKPWKIINLIYILILANVHGFLNKTNKTKLNI